MLNRPAFVDTHLHLSLGGNPRENARRQYDAGIGLVRDTLRMMVDRWITVDMDLFPAVGCVLSEVGPPADGHQRSC